jgi:hypothetical protein
MKSLKILAENPFLATLSEASYPNRVQFLDDTIYRFEANNPAGVYNLPLGLLKNNVGIFKSSATELQLGDQKSATATVDVTIDSIMMVAKRLKTKLEDSFGIKTTKLMEFFPKGFSKIHNTKRGDVAIVLKLWKDKAANTYSSQLGAVWVTELATLENTWATALKIQSTEKKGVGTGRKEAVNIIPTIAQNLWDLYILVLQKNQPHAENVVGNYFNTTPLLRKENSDHDGLGRTMGNVQDTNNNALKIVNISIVDTEGQFVWKGKTNALGNFRTSNLPIGIYKVTIEKEGYNTQQISQEILDDEDTSVNITLELGLFFSYGFVLV